MNTLYVGKSNNVQTIGLSIVLNPRRIMFRSLKCLNNWFMFGHFHLSKKFGHCLRWILGLICASALTKSPSHVDDAINVEYIGSENTSV